MKRSEETKKRILAAAESLFRTQGYKHVTMRQIANHADCSHTTIYLYFSDKETLLHDLSVPYLEKLKHELESINRNDVLHEDEKLLQMCLTFIKFGLENNNMYTLFIQADASRVDEKEPKQEINKIRIFLFRYLTEAIENCLQIKNEEQLLTYTRILFFYLHGSVSTYSSAEESTIELWSRLSETFEMGIKVILKGFLKNEQRGEV